MSAGDNPNDALRGLLGVYEAEQPPREVEAKYPAPVVGPAQTMSGHTVLGLSLPAVQFDDVTIFSISLTIPTPAGVYYIGANVSGSVDAGITGGMNPPYDALMGHLGGSLTVGIEAGERVSGLAIGVELTAGFEVAHEEDNILLSAASSLLSGLSPPP